MSRLKYGVFKLMKIAKTFSTRRIELTAEFSGSIAVVEVSSTKKTAATAIAAVEMFLGGRAIADEVLRSALADSLSPG